MITLAVEKRAETGAGKMGALRASGMMPAVFYGPKEASTPVSVDAKEFGKIWKRAGESSVILLKESQGTEHEALIHAVDFHPVSGAPRHADFYIVEKGKKVEVEVPLEFTGVAPAVKDLGGILVKVLRAVRVEAAPRDLPHRLEADISRLATLADIIRVRDLAVPAGVELKIKPDEIVASVAEAKEEIEEAASAPDLSSIEVEAKGKEAKEGAEGAEVGAAKSGEAKPGAKPGEGKK